jgi:predicted ferric reductase
MDSRTIYPVRLPLWNGRAEEHTFTISSAPEEKQLRITLDAVEVFTTELQKTITPGTEVRIRGPFGTFCRNADRESSITLIAGGIGITPYFKRPVSLLPHRRKRPHRSLLGEYYNRGHQLP